MMYSEFVEGTGCRDNAHNRKVFENLEVMYMNSEMSKAEIYEYGKKLVDNSKSPEQIAIENKVNTQIKELKDNIEFFKNLIETCEFYIGIETDSCYLSVWKHDIRTYKNEIRKLRNEIKALKWVLE